MTDAPMRAPERYDYAPIDTVHPSPHNPRTNITAGSLKEMVASIDQHGIIEPLIVRDRGSEGFEIIMGERRYLAAQIAGLTSVPVIVRDLADEAAALQQLVENLQRQDLAPLQEAGGYQRLIDEFGYTAKSIAEKVNKKLRTVYATLALLKLHDEVKAKLARGEINATTASIAGRLPLDHQAIAINAIPSGTPVYVADDILLGYDPAAIEKAAKKAESQLKTAKKKVKKAKVAVAKAKAPRTGIAAAKQEQAALQRALVIVTQRVHDHVTEVAAKRRNDVTLGFPFNAFTVFILRQFDIEITDALAEVRGLQKILGDDAKEQKWLVKVADDELFSVWLESLVSMEYGGFKEEPLNDLLEFCGLPKYGVMLREAKKQAAADLATTE